MKTTFDSITLQRPALASAYLTMLVEQPGRPLALFAPRRVGKTFFLDNDLAPAARSAGMYPVYADLWLYKTAPLDAINHALEEALDDIQVPPTSLGKSAKTSVKSMGALGVSVALGDTPTRRTLPLEPALRFDALIVRLSKAFGGKILLLLDEVQTLGEVTNGPALIGAIRAVLHKQRNYVAAVFTGSSQQGLSLIMNTAGAPMYQFAQIINFPYLGEEYLSLLREHFTRIHPGKTLDPGELSKVFARIGYRPALLRDIIKSMSAEGLTDIQKGVDSFMNSDSQLAIWNALLNSVDAFDRGILFVISQGLPPLGTESKLLLGKIPGVNVTVSKIRSSLERLQRLGIVAKTTNGYLLDDPLLAEYIQRQNVR